MIGLIALTVFWVLAARQWITDGPRKALVFIGLWVVGIFIFPLFDASGYLFVAFEAVMAVIMLVRQQLSAVI